MNYYQEYVRYKYFPYNIFIFQIWCSWFFETREQQRQGEKVIKNETIYKSKPGKNWQSNI